MKHFIWVISLLLVLFALSCQSKKTEKDDERTSVSGSEDLLTGDWINTYVKIEINSVNNTQQDSVLEAHPDNWESVLKMKPIRTTFRSDGSYQAEYRDVLDSLVYSPEGEWKIKGDSLIMETPSGVFKYEYDIQEDMVEFKGKIDWDKDGQIDDLYFGKQKRISDNQ